MFDHLPTGLPKIVVAVIGYDQANGELYGLSRDMNAYVISKDDGFTWYSVPAKRWEQVKPKVCCLLVVLVQESLIFDRVQ